MSLPNTQKLFMKVCQQNNKALMSNPNKALGEWLLRDVINIEKGTLLTYEILNDIGIDSVIIIKHGTNSYSINFCEIGAFDDFIQEYE